MNNRSLNRHVALKILTSRCYGGKKEVYELAILQRITNSDVKHPGWKHVLSLLDSFVHTGPNGDHVCLANEMMLGNLHELSFRFGPRRQLPVRLVKEVSRQMLSGLQYLHETCGVIHSGIYFFISFLVGDSEGAGRHGQGANLR